MSKTLVVVAHPDDEVLWFFSILMRNDCDVVCVTNGRDDGDRAHREPAFRKSMSVLGVENHWNLDYPDGPARLDILQLGADLKRFSSRSYDRVFTHSPFGETFEHSHHQDVCHAVHQTFENVHSVAWNAFPEIVNALTPSEYALKKYLLGTVYHDEYRNLKRTYPVLSVETFIEYSREAVDIFYWSIADGGNNHERLAKYDDFWGFQSSVYERERHKAILDFVALTSPGTILEYGSCEGVLTRKLSLIAETHCVETAPSYVAKLAAQGFKIVQSPRGEDYDTAVVASFLGYLDSPRQFLDSLRSEHLVVQVGLGSELENDMLSLLPRYDLSSQSVVRPRWEHLVRGGKSEISRFIALALASSCSGAQARCRPSRPFRILTLSFRGDFEFCRLLCNPSTTSCQARSARHCGAAGRRQPVQDAYEQPPAPDHAGRVPAGLASVEFPFQGPTLRRVLGLPQRNLYFTPHPRIVRAGSFSNS